MDSIGWTAPKDAGCGESNEGLDTNAADSRDVAGRLMDAICAPIDRLRRHAIAALGPLGTVMVRDRELRVTTVAALMILTALIVTIYAPFYLLLLGPVLLGVPHLIGDVRYLFVRPGLHRRALAWLAIAVPGGFAIAGKGSLAGAASLALCALIARAPLWRRAIVLLAAGLFALAALRSRMLTDMVVAHGHNVFAIVLWAMWRKRSSHKHWIPVAVFFSALALILGGAFDPLLRAFSSLMRLPDGVGVSSSLDWYAPGVASPWALRLTLAFIFAQSVHYAVWTRLVPEDDRARETPRSFAGSLRALRKDFGLWIFLALGLVALGITVWATWDMAAARLGYLNLSQGHAYIELAAALLLWMERGRHLGRLPAHEPAHASRLSLPRRLAFAFARM